MSADEVETQLTPTELVATEVVATEVVATEVVATEVLATQPIATQPIATQPVAPGEVSGTLLMTSPLDPAESAEPAPQALRRVGPGVPGATKQPGGPDAIDPAIVAAWHGAPEEKQKRSWHRGWLLPLAVLIGVILLLLWRNAGGQLSVSGASAMAGAPTIGCDTTETVTATLHTNGKAGTIDYRWVRSDGTTSDQLQQSVDSGTKQVNVVLRWAFTGHGSMDATARIEVESPGSASASAAFVYNCP